MPTKNAEYYQRHTQKQKELNRKPRRLFLTDDEFKSVKDFILNLRGES